MPEQFHPLSDRVMVLVDEPETVSAGGVIIADVAQERPYRGEVIAVGPGRTLDDGAVATPDIERGDVVVFQKFAGIHIDIDTVEYLILRESDIMGVVTE